MLLPTPRSIRYFIYAQFCQTGGSSVEPPAAKLRKWHMLIFSTNFNTAVLDVMMERACTPVSSRGTTVVNCCRTVVELMPQILYSCTQIICLKNWSDCCMFRFADLQIWRSEVTAVCSDFADLKSMKLSAPNCRPGRPACWRWSFWSWCWRLMSWSRRLDVGEVIVLLS